MGSSITIISQLKSLEKNLKSSLLFYAPAHLNSALSFTCLCAINHVWATTSKQFGIIHETSQMGTSC